MACGDPQCACGCGAWLGQCTRPREPGMFQPVTFRGPGAVALAQKESFDLTTCCALCGQKLLLAYEGKALWDQDPPLGQYTSDRLDMLCSRVFGETSRLKAQLSRATAEIAGLRAVVKAAVPLRGIADSEGHDDAVAAFVAAMAKLKETT